MQRFIFFWMLNTEIAYFECLSVNGSQFSLVIYRDTSDKATHCRTLPRSELRMKRALPDETHDTPVLKLVKFTGVDVVLGATSLDSLSGKPSHPAIRPAARHAYGHTSAFLSTVSMQAMDLQDMGPQQQVKTRIVPTSLDTHMDQKSLLMNHIRVIARRLNAWPETEIQAIINMEKYDKKRTASMAPINSSLAAACFALAVKQFQTWTMSLSEIADDFSGIGGSKCDAASVNAAERHVLSVLGWDVIDNSFLKMQPPETHNPLKSAFSQDKSPLDVAMHMVKGIVLGSSSEVDLE